MTTEDKPAESREEQDETRERQAVVERLSALQGYLALGLLAAGIGFEAGLGWGVAVFGLGLFADAWRHTASDLQPSQEEEL